MQNKALIPHSHPWINDFDIKAVLQNLNSSLIADGSVVADLHRDMCKLLNIDNFYFTPSGSAALYMILKGVSLSPNDEIILPSYVCQSVIDAVNAAQLTPVLCDIEENFIISLDTIEPKISPNTKALIIPQLYGISLDIKQFRNLNLILINDLCQNFDSAYDLNQDRGDFFFCSFHATKCLTSGHGGGFTILNKAIAFNEDNIFSADQFFFRMSDIQASLLRSQLHRYKEFTNKRKKIAEFYFDSIPSKLTMKIPTINNSFYRFPLTQKKYEFNKISELFHQENIIIKHGVDTLLHRLYGYSDSMFPNSVNCFNDTVSIPIYPSLSIEEAQRIANLCQKLV